MLGAFSLWIFLLITGAGLVRHFHIGVDAEEYGYSLEPTRYVDFSEFMENVDAGKITEVHFRGGYLIGCMPGREGIEASYTKPPTKLGYRFIERLMQKGVRIMVDDADHAAWKLINYASQWVVPIMLGLSAVYILRRRRNFFGIGTSILREAELPGVSFKDVAGVDDAKESLSQVVDFLKNPEKFKRLGASVPRGVLLYGPPGTGKTLLARCVAGESNSEFLFASGAGFVEIFVGAGAKRVREAFRTARSKAPAILFIDEIDALAGTRRMGAVGGTDEHAHTLTQLLEEMDGFDKHEDSIVVVIAATNRKEALDKAVLRPGRFDRHIYVGYPDVQGRRQILEVHLQKIKYANLDVELLARRTQGFSGADIKNLINESALIATKKEKNAVEMEDFEEGWHNVVAGPVRNRQMTKDHRRQVAYHEAGHALVALLTHHSMEIDRVTIVPRGQSYGMLISLPREEELLNRAELLDTIAVSLGGRAAEALVFGKDKVTNGAMSDLSKVTAVANQMVFEWGMRYGEGEESLTSYQYHPERYMTIPQKILESKGEMVNQIVSACYERAFTLLKQNRKLLDQVVAELLERETITREELEKLLEKHSASKSKKTKGGENGLAPV